MALNWKQAVQYLTNKPAPRRGYGVQSEMAIPPGWGVNEYLQSYGQIGWLFGCVSLIATSVAEVEWHLFKGDKELDNHPLLDLINKVNPFQTRYQFFLMLQTYRTLVGEAFIALNYKGSQPYEMWLAAPQNMTVVPDPQSYIKGYFYQAGATKIPFTPQEIIYICSPNPVNPMRGMGVVQPISTDLQNEKYATRYTNKLFYNDATPGFILEIPEMYTAEQRKEYQEDWDTRHKGWGNARKTGFLWGGAHATNVTMTNKDMDFTELRKLSKEVILGACHVPTSLMGLAEVGSRARAEADEYIFAKRVVKPALQGIKESFNEQLCPLFGDDLTLDFDNPVPQNKEADDTSTRANFTAGIITREEARPKLGYDPEAASGETYMIPFSLSPLEAKSVKNPSESQQEAKWRGYIAKTEGLERPFKRAFKSYFDNQEEDVIKALKINQSADGALFADEPADKDFVTTFKPLIAWVMTEGWNDALREFSKSTHKQAFDLLSHEALEWITNRSLSLAKMVNGTTKEQLRAILAAEFAKGSSIAQITSLIKGFYKDGYEKRAPMVARTEVITASNQGANALYKAEGVQKIQWYTALDERTCEECNALHRETFPIDDGPRPALHVNCRCTITAYLD